MSYRGDLPAGAVVGKGLSFIPVVGNILSAAWSLFGGSVFDDPSVQIAQWQAQMQKHLYKPVTAAQKLRERRRALAVRAMVLRKMRR